MGKAKPPSELRVVVAVRLPPASRDLLRSLASSMGKSQADVIASLLEAARPRWATNG